MIHFCLFSFLPLPHIYRNTRFVSISSRAIQYLPSFLQFCGELLLATVYVTANCKQFDPPLFLSPSLPPGFVFTIDGSVVPSFLNFLPRRTPSLTTEFLAIRPRIDNTRFPRPIFSPSLDSPAIGRRHLVESRERGELIAELFY